MYCTVLYCVLQLRGGGDTALLELHGDHLHPALKVTREIFSTGFKIFLQVWFGDVEAAAGVSGHVSPGTCLQCVVPDISHFYPPGCSWLAQPTQVVARTILHIRAANDPFVFTITDKRHY